MFDEGSIKLSEHYYKLVSRTFRQNLKVKPEIRNLKMLLHISKHHSTLYLRFPNLKLAFIKPYLF